MTVMDQTAPARSLQQRMAALEHANRIRMARAQLKRDIVARRARAVDVLTAPPEWAHTMRVLDLLLAIPKVGRVKAMRMLNRHGISPSKTLGGLTVRQFDALLGELDGR
jgi:hypothetical protein